LDRLVAVVKLEKELLHCGSTAMNKMIFVRIVVKDVIKVLHKLMLWW